MIEIKREKYLKRIRPFYDSEYIKVITGIRRCGKSVLMKQIIDEIKDKGVDDNHIIVLNLEGKSGEGIKTRKDLEERLDSLTKDSEKYYIFIDEVQHIKDFEEAIASVRVSYKCSLFVTGSNSKMLHGTLQDRLTGRAKEFPVYPFTYQETVAFKKANGIEIDEDDFFDFLHWGGMPQRYEEIDESGLVEYFQSLYHSIILKDVYQNHKRISKEAFENVASYVMMTSGREFSSTSVERYLKKEGIPLELSSSARSISNYEKLLEECFLVTECKPYIISGKKSLNGTKKVYAVDQGLRNSFSNTINTDDSFGLENIVFQQLKADGYEVRTGSLRDGEIDFVAIKGKKKCFIQVAYYLSTQEIIDREYGAYKKVKDASPKFVISLDRIDTSRDGITHLNLIDFLLGKVELYLS